MLSIFSSNLGRTGIIIPKPITSIRTVIRMKETAAFLGFDIMLLVLKKKSGLTKFYAG
jgi:hypothetical protein